jgi:hypothetical protein
VGAGPVQAGSQPLVVDQQMPQLPLIVRKCLDHRVQAGDVSAKSLARAVDVLSDEFAKFVEPMLIAPFEITPEMTLIVIPVILGQGARLFPETGPDLALDLVESRVDSKGVTIQVFRPAGPPQYATA